MSRRAKALPQIICVHCAYDLRGSRETGHCPECGWHFDPSTVMIGAWKYQEWPRMWKRPFQIANFGLSIFLLVMAFASPWAAPWIRIVAGATGVVTLSGGIRVLRNSHDAYRRRPTGCLLLFRNSVGYVPLGGSALRATRYRWRDVERIQIRKVGKNLWRLRMYISRWPMIDALVPATKREAAALRSEVRMRRRASRLNRQESIE